MTPLSCNYMLGGTNKPPHHPETWNPPHQRLVKDHVQRAIARADDAASPPHGQSTAPNNDIKQAQQSYDRDDGAYYPLPPLTPALEALRELIESEPRVYMLFTQMFAEIPRRMPRWDAAVMPQVSSWRQMLAVLKQVVTTAPRWDNVAYQHGFVGVPMGILLEYASGTPSGYAAFLNPDVTRCFRDILDEWGRFLQTPASAPVLGNDGYSWLGSDALYQLERVGNEPYGTRLKFEELFECDPAKEHYGFHSWDDFFTRRFRRGVRPTASPNNRAVITNPCESTPYNIAHNAKLRDDFFAKGQPYSILDMLGHDSLATHFAGATVYQAFLSPVSYHRWHAPVSGTVRRAFVKGGTYFSQPVFVLPESSHGGNCSSRRGGGFRAQDERNEQGYISALATRAVIIISAEDPRIGLVAFVAIGMDEVSTCDITIKEGQRIEKGQETGMFHFGGSSFCLVFQPGVVLDGFPSLSSQTNVAVNSKLAVVQDLQPL
ncbi:hypothetical protein K4F52_009842 [Lecanicillium sp. MT-2017a]|nr:hypothetical protein K4F52_009842 [Lecanicillium sp. MT-2017a]